MTTHDDTETIEGLDDVLKEINAKPWPDLNHAYYLARLMKLIEEPARRYAQQDGWQPIETAPKDGTWVLLWCGWQIVGRFVVKGRRVKKGWTDDIVGLNPIFHVTHWMPLPAAPKPEGE